MVITMKSFIFGDTRKTTRY